ncbi:MAG: rod shape-determining protein MreC [Clostridia bacterium]|nr:rod shape-determining protein MreC [Clostridia bacterium]
MYKKKRYGILGIIVTIIILILLFTLTNTENSNLSYIENLANKLVMPIQNGMTYLKNKVNGNSSFFINVDHLKEENDGLQQRNSELEEKLRELETVKAENETLKQYLNLTKKYTDYKTVPADVINRDISNYSKTIVINVGTNDGIKENMTVIAAEGLVGHVIAVTDTTAKVETIIDSSSSTSCLLSTSRDSIVCKGVLNDKKHIKAMYIATDATVSQGDTIETSGLGGIYQKGIYVGTISKVENSTDLTNRYALVELAVNFDKLETVLVVTN